MNNLHYYPLAVFVWFPVSVGITYSIAVYLKDVPVLYPYISDTGTFSPESCIFAQFLNIGAALMAFVAYIRYRQVRHVCENHDVDKKILKQNKTAFYLACTAAFGVSLVGNFQETNVFSIHLLGAHMAFGVGSAYMVYSTKISYGIYPIACTKRSLILKTTCAIICSTSYTICFVTIIISFSQFDGEDFTKWNATHAGYKAHVVSAISEWVTAFSMMAYISTFQTEFKVLVLEEPKVFSADDNVIETPSGERF